MFADADRAPSMKIALISDIHSNIEALTTALAYLDDAGVDQIICLGDIVGYGADPNPCCELIRERCDVTLMGNHDAAVIGQMNTDYYYEAAREAIRWTRQVMSPENFQWMYSLPYSHVISNAAFFHSAPLRPSGFYYVVETKDAQAHTPIFDRLRPWNFVGHSHLTQCFMLTDRRAKDVTGKTLKVKDGQKLIINVGSVGQPRDRDARLCFGLFDSEAETFEYVRLHYDIASTAQKITDAGLDSKFAKRLFIGH
jgi:predicted phosphodiesterase